MDELIERIEDGLTGEQDAIAVARLLAEAMRYYIALRMIAAYGGGCAAQIAAQALAGEERDHAGQY